MKKLIIYSGIFCALLLVAGCAVELAQTPVGVEEAAWQQVFRQNYSGYRPPRTAPPATADNVSEKLRESELEKIRAAKNTDGEGIVPQPAEEDPATVVDAAAAEKNTAESADKEPAAVNGEKSDSKDEKAAAVSDGKEIKDTKEFTATPPEPTDGTVHVVKAGETLGGIAKKYYGDASASGVIERANVDIVKNPNLLRPGMKLIIPKL